MPNWCENELTIRGRSGVLACLEAIKGEPDEDATDTRATIAFRTAWSPPEPVILELSKQFPKLTFTLKYWEGGAAFRGILRVKAGEVLRAASYHYAGPRGG